MTFCKSSLPLSGDLIEKVQLGSRHRDCPHGVLAKGTPVFPLILAKGIYIAFKKRERGNL